MITPGAIQRRLRARLRQASRLPSLAPRQIFLELFSGSGNLSVAVRRKGVSVLSFDIKDGDDHDITHPVVLDTLEGWIRSGCVAGISFAVPCVSFSVARRGPWGSSWGPLRSRDYPHGIPGLGPDDLDKIRTGDRCLRAACRLLRAAISCQVPAWFENPVGSLMWSAKPFAPLLKTADLATLDFCQFGAPWRKRTRWASWNAAALDPIARRCGGHGGICSRSGTPHVVLQGYDSARKCLRTQAAAAYPPALCSQLAKIICDIILNLRCARASELIG